MGEEGLYYTAVNLKDLVINKESISFVVPGRSFYSERPKSVSDAVVMKETGATRTELKMTGKLENGKLVLHCTSPNSTCPDGKIIFENGK